MPSGYSSTQKAQTLKLPTSKRRSFLDRATAKYSADVLPVIPYLESRGISAEIASRWQLGYVLEPLGGHEDYQGRLSIPYLTPAGTVTMKFRCVAHDDCRTMQCVKYLGEPGEVPRLFGVWNLRKDEPVIALCEGELDTIVATSVVGIPAVGVPGSTQWRSYWSHLFDGYDEVVLLRDGDRAGREMSENLAGRLHNLRIVKMPEGHDVSSFVLAEGRDALLERIGL